MHNFINEDFMNFLNQNKLFGSVVVFFCCMGAFSILDKLFFVEGGDAITTLVIQTCLSLVFTISALPKHQQ